MFGAGPLVAAAAIAPDLSARDAAQPLATAAAEDTMEEEETSSAAAAAYAASGDVQTAAAGAAAGPEAPRVPYELKRSRPDGNVKWSSWDLQRAEGWYAASLSPTRSLRPSARHFYPVSVVARATCSFPCRGPLNVRTHAAVTLRY